MPKIRNQLFVEAPIDLVFDLSRSIDFHEESMRAHGERAIAGTISGLIELGQSVTWRARHFGTWLELTSKLP